MFFFFLNDTATTEIYTLSLHDALPISFAHAQSLRSQMGCIRSAAVSGVTAGSVAASLGMRAAATSPTMSRAGGDRKSTRLNSSHVEISYAVFCLKKKKKEK